MGVGGVVCICSCFFSLKIRRKVVALYNQIAVICVALRMLQQKAQAGNTTLILNRRTAYSIAGTHFFSELITMLILVAILVPLTGTSIAILTKIHTTMLLLGPRPRGHHPIRMQYTPDRMLAGRSTSAGGRGLGPWIRGGPS